MKVWLREVPIKIREMVNQAILNEVVLIKAVGLGKPNEVVDELIW